MTFVFGNLEVSNAFNSQRKIMLGTEFIFRYMSTCKWYLLSMSGVVIVKMEEAIE